MRHPTWIAGVVLSLGLAQAPLGQAAERALIDAHIHYSHDALERLPPDKAIEVLRRAGLKRAFVSSSSDDGTQALYRLAPELILPVLRPYRRRGETSSWKTDPSVIDMLRDRLARYRYYGIGEFHAFGDDFKLPVLQQTIALAKQYGLFLHAHSDAEGVALIFDSDPDALVVWAHSGFDDAATVRGMLQRYDNLWADLAFRSDFADGETVDEDWAALFADFPERFLLGTDTYTPERWFYVIEQADWSRGWLDSLPADLADNIAFGNAERLIRRVRP